MQITQTRNFIKEHKLFSLSVVILFLSFVVVLFFLFGTLRRPGTAPSLSETKNHTTPPPALTVVSVDPENNALINKLYPQMIIIFSKPITSFERANVSISTSPVITGEKTWASDQKTLFFTPTQALLPSTTYTVSIDYGDTKISGWVFSTVSASNVTLEDQVRAQSDADKNFSSIQENILRDYPWYNSLPLQTTTYFVYFDVSKNKFIGQLYAPDAQATELKSEIIIKLQSLGIDTSRYPVEWIMHTVSPTPLPD